MPYFVEFYSDDSNPVTVTNISITYSCSPHETSLDKYRIMWVNDEGKLLETDYDVEPGTMPTYNSSVPNKDPISNTFYAFSGWYPELSPVSENTTYRVTFTEVALTFTLIDSGAAYELTSIGDSTIEGFAVPSMYEGLPVTSLGAEVFMNFSSLSGVSLPNTLKTINSDAFTGCTSLTSLYIPGSVETINSMAFGGCSSLTDIDVDFTNVTYASVDGVLFSKDLSVFFSYPANHGTSYTIPNTVTTIGEYAFVAAETLLSVSIPNSVTTITDNAFRSNSFLSSVYIPSSVTTILAYGFYLCSNLNIYYTVSAPQTCWASTWNASNVPVTWNYVG